MLSNSPGDERVVDTASEDMVSEETASEDTSVGAGDERAVDVASEDTSEGAGVPLGSPPVVSSRRRSSL